MFRNLFPTAIRRPDRPLNVMQRSLLVIRYPSILLPRYFAISRRLKSWTLSATRGGKTNPKNFHPWARFLRQNSWLYSLFFVFVISLNQSLLR